ncbi:hypothetical protein PR048_006471 [Dryococelus australis]|uniref:Uncharacterized protein n=1 Tax=Dryococelus australis TaxID=614101 RepID=A0ABQ9IB27_9NEOP|nr:hypothetical protein PR048_006471 [Dryococelus australis]
MEANVIKLTSESNWNTDKEVYDVVTGKCGKPEPGTDDYEKALKEWKQRLSGARFNCFQVG